MSSKISRRTAIEVVGGAALGAAAYEVANRRLLNRATFIKNRVNLICHGMLGFYCYPMGNPPTITILIPHSPTMTDASGHTVNAHVVRLSESVGGLPNRLNCTSSPEVCVPADYTLDFGAYNVTPGDFSNASNVMENLVLFEHGVGNHKLQINRGGVFASITVPYPTTVRNYRIMTYHKPPIYDVTGDTSKTFKVQNLNMLSGVNVLTYDFDVPANGILPVVTLTQTSARSGTPYIFGHNIALNYLNLHLYSQPVVKEGYMGDHLPCFNALFAYTHMDSTSGTLDLVSNKECTYQAPCTAPAVGTLDDDLAAEDVMSLTELPKVRESGKVNILLADPAECVQGWGS